MQIAVVVQVVQTIGLIWKRGPEEECLRQTRTQMRRYQAEDAKWLAEWKSLVQ